MSDSIAPKDRGEEVALFRAQVLGPLLCRSAEDRGELAERLRELSAEPVRVPGSSVHRTFAVSTLERWYYAYLRHGLEGLRPRRPSHGKLAGALTEAQRELILQIRRERPAVSTSLILRTLEADGRLEAGQVSDATVRRLFAVHGLDRTSLSQRCIAPRRRWEAATPMALWHSDVCHGPSLRVEGRSVPLRIHALLDDKSRYVIAIQACATERESEMLALFAKATRTVGVPKALYLDNGATYRGKALSTVCGRLGVAVLHAKPYDPQARGKMERLWRTLRAQCLDFCRDLGSLHDVQVRLLAWLETHYHRTAHASLMGKSPAEVFEAHTKTAVPEAMLREAMIARGRRRIRRDGTLSIAGTEFETTHGYLAGRMVIIGRSLLVPTEMPWLEHEAQRLALRPLDPVAQGKRRRPKRNATGIDAVPFDPPTVMVDQLVGRAKKAGER